VIAPLPPDETQRLAALRRYDVLDTPPDVAFDDLARLAAQICQAPIAMVTIVDEHRQWCKSAFGVSATETPRNGAFCAHAILHRDDVLEVPDALVDPRFADSALVTSDPNIRFYAGAPLVTPDGHALGTLCVMDRTPREMSAGQMLALRALSRHVVAELELRRQSRELQSEIAERKAAEARLRQQNEELERAARDSEALVVLAKKSRSALLNVLEDEQLAGNSLRASEERFRQLVDGAHDYAIVMLDAHGRVTSWNKGAQRLKGYTADEIEGQYYSRFHPEDAVRVGVPEKELAEAAAEGRFEHEGWRVRKDGSRFWASVIITALRDEAGLLRGFSKITRDITERKQAEDEIRTLNADLECRVQQRTRELEAANKELEAFSFSVSHDLRAPLRHVRGYVDMLQRATQGQLSDKARRYLQTIDDASADMGKLIDDLLDFSRLGRAEMNEHSVSLDKVVQETIRGLEMGTQDRNILWTIAALPQVKGDPSLLKQVFANLIGNAVKYSRQRDPATIELGSVGQEDGRVVLFVRDNGAGFDMQYAEKLFGVFQRLHRAEDFEGTGIGLAIVQRVIARHGGRTWAEGKVGEGATFYFTLAPAT